MQLPNYGKIWGIDELWIEKFPTINWNVQEKLDGSQFSFGLVNDVLVCQSKNTQLDLKHPNKMFSKAVAWCVENKERLDPCYIYRAEALNSTRHNHIKYDAVPDCGFVIFDIENKLDGRIPLLSGDVYYECLRLSIPCVDTQSLQLADVENSLLKLWSKLPTISMLGGKPEGFVFKSNTHKDDFGYPLRLKLVSSEFKERANKPKQLKQNNSVVDKIVEVLATEARWRKAVQHVAEQDGDMHGNQSIPALLKELSTDTMVEEQDYIQNILWREYWPKINKALANQFVAWYKAQQEK